MVVSQEVVDKEAVVLGEVVKPVQWSKSRWSEKPERRSKQSEAIPEVVIRVVQVIEADVGVEVQVTVIPEVVLPVVEVQRDVA